MLRRLHTKGQALLEFTLASTLIFFMLAAAVDLGLIFLNLQGLHNAAEEGASYGSHPVVGSDGHAVIDVNGIIDRARHEAGDQGIGYVNLLDLNKDGKPDDQESGVLTGPNAYITIETFLDANGDGKPDSSNQCSQTNLDAGGFYCFIKVTVATQYNLVFPLAPAFAPSFRIQSSYIMPIRSTYIRFNT